MSAGGKGSGRRPGEGFQDGWERVFGRSAPAAPALAPALSRAGAVQHPDTERVQIQERVQSKSMSVRQQEAECATALACTCIAGAERVHAGAALAHIPPIRGVCDSTHSPCIGCGGSRCCPTL